jgi:hypothetical protein
MVTEPAYGDNPWAWAGCTLWGTLGRDSDGNGTPIPACLWLASGVPTFDAARSVMPGRTAEGETWRVARPRILLRLVGGGSTEGVCP